ncbi:hypothetical protein VNO77_18207 [Canavalia gladiata]|uniref:Uncharacterized protein n=1 Tax=Canavalia gladiata TaxID=3824 RepID=A0AAN9QJE6_CANGL
MPVSSSVVLTVYQLHIQLDQSSADSHANCNYDPMRLLRYCGCNYNLDVAYVLHDAYCNLNLNEEHFDGGTLHPLQISRCFSVTNT